MDVSYVFAVVLAILIMVVIAAGLVAVTLLLAYLIFKGLPAAVQAFYQEAKIIWIGREGRAELKRMLGDSYAPFYERGAFMGTAIFVGGAMVALLTFWLGVWVFFVAIGVLVFIGCVAMPFYGLVKFAEGQKKEIQYLQQKLEQ